jgi:hypothetical protein
MTTSTSGHNSDNVIDLFSRKPFSSSENRRFVRISPELDNLEMLYSNASNPDKLFSLRILFWGLRADGEIVGLVPWMEQLTPCPEIHDELNGNWIGYYDAGIDELFTEPPLHKVIELETAVEYFSFEDGREHEILQELPDTIGTHAVLSEDGFKTITLKEVVSWRLQQDGQIIGTLTDDEKVEATPVLPGDECLYTLDDEPNFRYFFQHHIANKIKSNDPEAMAAISLLVE